MLTTSEYQEEAQRTSVPPTPELISRLKAKRNLSYLAHLLADMTFLGEKMDTLKRSIFYGKGGLTTESKEVPEAEEAAARIKTDAHVKVIHGIIGKITEAGEMAAALAQWLFIHEGTLDVDNVIEEVGDGLWYDAELLTGLESTFDVAMKANIAKLFQRYPDKFSQDSAVFRDIEKERLAMKGTMTGGTNE